MLGVAALFLIGYLVIAPLSHTPVLARVPMIIGYVAVAVAAVLQTVFAQQMKRDFPRVSGMALKVALGVLGLGIGGFAFASLLSVVMLLFRGGALDRGGYPLLFGCCVLVIAPVCSYLLFAALKVREVEKKYGPDGTAQLLAFQAWQQGQPPYAGR